MSGRTIYVPKDAAWWRRSRVVELGQEHGPAGPAVIDWLTCEARSQGPIRGHDGRVKAGFAAIAHGCFLSGGAAEAEAIVRHAVEVGLLDDFEPNGRTFTCRISGWRHDLTRGMYRFAVERGDHRVIERRLMTRKLRKQILDRDRHRCARCHVTDDLQIDHIVPIAAGGFTTPENLQVLCGPCNRAKGARA